MGIPLGNGDTVVLPVHRLPTAVVMLPGILYRVSFAPLAAQNLLQFYRGGKKLNNLLLSQVPIKAPEQKQKRSITEAAVGGGRQLRRLLNGERGDEAAYDWLLLGVVPQGSTSVCTISRIVGISGDKTSVVVTFQALARGQITGDSVDLGDQPVEAKIRALSNRVDLGFPYLDEQVKSYQEKVNSLFFHVDSFLSDFAAVSSSEKAASQGKRYALTLSPLANVLNLQFNGEYKTSSVKLKGLIDNFLGKMGDYSGAKTSEDFLKLLDLTIAILPIPKLEFLSKLESSERVAHFHYLIDGLSEVFEALYTSVDYVDKFYSTSTDLEKSKIISNQLKSLRFTLDTLRPKTSNAQGSIPGRAQGGAGAGVNQDEENEEMELIRKFLDKVPHDVNPDGVKLLKKDFKRLQRMPQQHSEYQVLRTYFDIVMDLPWGQYINLKDLNIAGASKQLDDDHYGLYHVKKRLLQYLSVLKLHSKADEATGLSQADQEPQEEFIIGDDPTATSTITKAAPEFSKKKISKAPILLFVGPPGVGKTSLAKSIATTLGRKFQRISLGGVRDESDIRGHRRTYVGSMPGMLVNALRKAGSMNPVILLDEIDKVSGGSNSAGRINGDPAAALLEVLDPEQNSNFTDHYLGFPIDLSNVLFLCTANELDTISAPLRDRTEIIELSGYTLEEKMNIGSRYLLSKQVKQNGLHPGDVVMEDAVWKKVISEYIREAGVRNLERKVGAICRGKAVELVEDEAGYDKNVSELQLIKYLGLPAHPISRDLLDKPRLAYEYGVVNGLSYNSDGSGSALVFEVISIPTMSKSQNSPNLVLTGRLGETLTESIKIGVSFIKSMISRGLINGIDSVETLSRFNNSEMHLHVPMGGISKDGPSAGITITLALLSVALQRPVSSSIAMTGEITLRGKVLPIGGISEKLLGASQFGITTVLVPKSNRKDVIEGFYNDDVKLMDLVTNDSDEPEKMVKAKLGIDLIYVDTFWDVLKAVWGESVVVDEHLAHL